MRTKNCPNCRNTLLGCTWNRDCYLVSSMRWIDGGEQSVKLSRPRKLPMAPPAKSRKVRQEFEPVWTLVPALRHSPPRGHVRATSPLSTSLHFPFTFTCHAADTQGCTSSYPHTAPYFDMMCSPSLPNDESGMRAHGLKCAPLLTNARS